MDEFTIGTVLSAYTQVTGEWHLTLILLVMGQNVVEGCVIFFTGQLEYGHVQHVLLHSLVFFLVYLLQYNVNDKASHMLLR